MQILNGKAILLHFLDFECLKRHFSKIWTSKLSNFALFK